MPKLSNAAMLAARQAKAVDALLAKARRAVVEVSTTEQRGEERMARLLKLADKFGPLNASSQAVAAYWSCVEKAQAQLDELCSTERVRVSEEGAEALDSVALEKGGVL